MVFDGGDWECLTAEMVLGMSGKAHNSWVEEKHGVNVWKDFGSGRLLVGGYFTPSVK